jgi:MFS family permease
MTVAYPALAAFVPAPAVMSLLRGPNQNHRERAIGGREKNVGGQFDSVPHGNPEGLLCLSESRKGKKRERQDKKKGIASSKRFHGDLDSMSFWREMCVSSTLEKTSLPKNLWLAVRKTIRNSVMNPEPLTSSQPAINASGPPEVTSLRGLSPQQWKSGIAAWLGWLFDGLDMHLYVLVAAPFVAQLVHATSAADALVKEKSSWIQAAFLVGWALGGSFFGRIGDVLGRSRALSLTILTYALFTGLSSIAQTWWQLLIFRFLAALGIGGEWAVGSSLLSETWPRKWRPWIAAVLQTGVNIGVLLACLTTFFMADQNPRYVFLVGILPALLVFWIRRHVPEPAEWHSAKRKAQGNEPSVLELFRGEIRRTTLLTIIVCACSLSAWWAFMFWNQQHMRNLPDIAAWPVRQKEQLVSSSFFLVIVSSILGNFFAGWLARMFGPGGRCSPDVPSFFVAMTGVLLGITIPCSFGFLSSGSFGRLDLLPCICRHCFRRCCGRPARDSVIISAASQPLGRCSSVCSQGRRFSAGASVCRIFVRSRDGGVVVVAGATCLAGPVAPQTPTVE